jgi:hypothetical protein
MARTTPRDKQAQQCVSARPPTNASIAANVASGCSICGRWPAFAISSNRPFGIAAASARP